MKRVYDLEKAFLNLNIGTRFTYDHEQGEVLYSEPSKSIYIPQSTIDRLPEYFNEVVAYRLKKDTPQTKAGTIFYRQKSNYNPENYFYSTEGNVMNAETFSSHNVENNDEWFEYVEHKALEQK